MKSEEFIVRGNACGREDTCGDVEVSLNGLALPLHLELVNHSPTGFNWGYSGSGPSQLAFAIVYEYLIRTDGFNLKQAKNLAECCYHEFKGEFIAPLPQTKDWEITGIEINSFLLQWCLRNLD